MRKFYNYVYLDPRKPGRYSYKGLSLSFLFEPFYVGKGCRNRLYAHLSDVSSKKRTLKINKIKAILRENFDLRSHIIQINRGLSSKQSCDEEIRMIKTIGRISLKTGPLTNMTDGGEGLINPSTETRKLLSFPGDSNPQSLVYLISHGRSESEAKAYLKKKCSKWTKCSNRGLSYEEAYGEEKASSLKNQRSETMKLNRVAGIYKNANSNRKIQPEPWNKGKNIPSTKPKHTYEISFPDGRSFSIFGYLKTDVKRFCDEHSLSRTTISNAINQGPIIFENYSKNVQSRLMKNPRCSACLGISISSS